jgi:uncharacterized membrane protein YeaQ/YmgE (transglycosylase-associated protein family)
MGITSWIIFGLVAGITAKLLMPGHDPGGCIVAMALGVAGAFVGGFIFEQLTGQPQRSGSTSVASSWRSQGP